MLAAEKTAGDLLMLLKGNDMHQDLETLNLLHLRM